LIYFDDLIQLDYDDAFDFLLELDLEKYVKIFMDNKLNSKEKILSGKI
jgi:hypothetical protein